MQPPHPVININEVTDHWPVGCFWPKQEVLVCIYCIMQYSADRADPQHNVSVTSLIRADEHWFSRVTWVKCVKPALLSKVKRSAIVSVLILWGPTRISSLCVWADDLIWSKEKSERSRRWERKTRALSSLVRLMEPICSVLCGVSVAAHTLLCVRRAAVTLISCCVHSIYKSPDCLGVCGLTGAFLWRMSVSVHGSHLWINIYSVCVRRHHIRSAQNNTVTSARLWSVSVKCSLSALLTEPRLDHKRSTSRLECLLLSGLLWSTF